MKKRMILVSILTLALLAVSLSFAWYHNNRQVDLFGGISGSGVNSIKIRSNGVLQAAYAVGNDFDVPLSVEMADFGSSLQMKLNGNSYEDVTGNGLRGQMFSPILDQDGNTQADAELWQEATVDNAAIDGDAGQYIIADLYFRSDVPMDIYLLKDSSVLPKSQGNDLTNRSGVESKTAFRDFPDGLPSKNINQSSYGLFSRNLIAGATRVSFTEFDFTKGAFPTVPGAVWVPNTTVELKRPADRSLLSRVIVDRDEGGIEAVEETKCSYYQQVQENDTVTYTTTTVARREENENRLTGELYRVTDSGLEALPVSAFVGGELVPAVKIEKVKNPVPLIWNGTEYVTAAYFERTPQSGEEEDREESEDSEASENPQTVEETGFLVAASYNESNYDSYAYYTGYNGGIYVQKRQEGGYQQVTRGSAEQPWISNGTVFSEDTEIAAIEAGFIKDSGQYRMTVWMDQIRDFNQKEENYFYSDTKIGTTDQSGIGYYYTRIQIAIWVEGTDREADIALNGGEFEINLQFFGMNSEEEVAA